MSIDAETIASANKKLIDPEEVLRVCAQEAPDTLDVAPVDFHQGAVDQLLKKMSGSEPEFGNMAGELAQKMEQKARTPVKIPQRKARPIRDSDGPSYSGGDILGDLLDSIFD